MKKRIFWLSLLITFVSLLIYSGVSAEIYYDTSVEHAKDYLQVYENYYKIYSQEGNDLDVYEYSEILNGARVTYLRLDGVVIADSTNMGVNESHANREEVMSAIKDGNGFAVRHSVTVGKTMVYYCVKEGDKLIRVSLYTASFWSIYVNALPTVIWFLLVDTLICAVFTYFASSLILKPVEKLTTEAALNKKLTVRYEELKPIAEILNALNEENNKAISELANEKDIVLAAQKSKDEFISNVTHEMNTPLTSIGGYAEWLESGKLDSEQTKTAIKTIVSQSERLKNLIGCIINYSEIDNDSLPTYEVNLSKAAEESVAIVSPEAKKKGITIISEIEKGVIVNSRSERINEILGNLIRNAVKYNKECGTVTVKVVNLPKPELSVTDTGIGIAKENLDRIFDRFFTVDKSHGGKNGGFGLGLAVVKKLCKKAGWTLTVNSTVGEGSKFTIVFR